MGLVVRQIGEQRLVDVEHPGVAPVAGDLRGPGELRRVVRDDRRVRRVAVAAHVGGDELLAPRRDLGPAPGVVRLDGEPPALAVEAVVPEDLPVAGERRLRVEADERLRRGGGREADEEEEEEGGEESAGRHGRSRKVHGNDCRARR